MKTLLLGLTASILFAPVAQASPQADVDGYLAALSKDGIPGAKSDLLAIGKWVCQEVRENHFGADQVAAAILQNPTNTITLFQAHEMVNEAVTYLCVGGPLPGVTIV